MRIKHFKFSSKYMNTKLQVSDKKVSAAWGLYWTKYIGAGDNTQSTRTPGT